MSSSRKTRKIFPVLSAGIEPTTSTFRGAPPIELPRPLILYQLFDVVYIMLWFPGTCDNGDLGL